MTRPRASRPEVEPQAANLAIAQAPPGYPREDRCTVCGAHVGWILHPAGEALRLGRCDDHPLPDEAEAEQDEGETEQDQ